MVGEGAAAKFAIHSEVGGGVVHASNAFEEAAVECFKVSEGTVWGEAPGFAGVGEDWGNEGVKELAHDAGGVYLVFGTTAVKGVEGTLASSKKMGGGFADAIVSMEDNTKIAVMVG